MNSLDFLRDHSRPFAVRLTWTRPWEISRTLLCASAALYLICQVAVLLRKEESSSEVLAELHQTTDRLRRVESTLEILEKTVGQLLEEKHERVKRMLSVKLPKFRKRRKKKKRRRSTRSFRREIRILKRKMKVVEKR